MAMIGLIGSDDGDEDPKPGDTTFFGDRLQGGDGDDTIDGLGGADEIDGGAGNNVLRGGLHVDTVVGGSEAVPDLQFNMSQGPERRGPWGELSDSATLSGLTNVGGFEQAVLAVDFGVYVAWVDWRNGNSEIYVAFHPKDVGGGGTTARVSTVMARPVAAVSAMMPLNRAARRSSVHRTLTS